MLYRILHLSIALTVLFGPLRAQAQPSGTADIVWQHLSGQVHYWPMRNGQRQGGINVFTPVSNDWTLRGVGDVDSDGTADIVWQHLSGQVHYWPMRNGQRQGGINVFTPVSNDWTLRGVGDVDSDGTADIVWQHLSGQVHYWPMRSGQRQGGINVFTPVSNDWTLRGVGDVDSDGTADIVWQHLSGQVHYWPMRNGQRQGGINVFTPVSNDWTLRGVGDVDSDGTADIVWQHLSGQVHYWPMRNGQRQGGINVFTPVSNDWTLRGVGDVDSDADAVAGQRKSVNALTAVELMAFRRGVAMMKARDSAPRDSVDFRRSWLYWANMHAHFGPDCGGPVSGSGMVGVQTFSASNPAETATWCSCEHGNDRFLTWHRMYLWYFERVLQEASGSADLRLPYWDYATDPNLPAAYREQTYVNESGQTVPNPLFAPARQPGLNAGTSGLASNVRSASGAMGATTFGSFRGALENTPHGAVHCALVSGGCPNGLMGAVPASALDPIFYAHHTNIDRLYECWLRLDEAGRLPTDAAHLNTQYTFVEHDGSTPQRRVVDMLRLSQLGYSYATGGDCSPAPALAAAEGAQQLTGSDTAGGAADQPVQLAGPTRLERGVTTLRIALPQAAVERLSPRRAAPATPDAAGAARQRVYLVIEGLAFDATPGTLYNVYLAGAGGRRQEVGVINFFNMTAPRSHAHGGHDNSGSRQVFDATEALRSLSLDAAAQATLIFEPTTGLTDSSPTEAVAQISPQANVRFNSVRLTMQP